jgi:hypothetical protein
MGDHKAVFISLQELFPQVRSGLFPISDEALIIAIGLVKNDFYSVICNRTKNCLWADMWEDLMVL